jgi:hypothetical protein
VFFHNSAKTRKKQDYSSKLRQIRAFHKKSGQSKPLLCMLLYQNSNVHSEDIIIQNLQYFSPSHLFTIALNDLEFRDKNLIQAVYKYFVNGFRFS